MSALLDQPPFAPRDEATFLAELRALVAHHRQGCAPYAKLTPAPEFDHIEDAPYVHVGLFKRMALKTSGVRHRRTLLSSATSSGVSSKIALDPRSSELQAKSVVRILGDWIGTETARPLLILDSAKSLRQRNISARIAAALSIKPLADDLWFVVPEPGGTQVDWARVAEVASLHDEIVVYGFTWLLWLAWGAPEIPEEARQALATTRVSFVHSGGWKKLEDRKVDRERFAARLLEGVGSGSQVVDYYGMVEQVGLIYPECEAGYRHVPRWADVLVRDPYTGASLVDRIGALQLVNVLAWGGPYHSVLTEDRGRIVSGDCPCGRRAKRFELLGRLPRAEIRGCANV